MTIKEAQDQIVKLSELIGKKTLIQSDGKATIHAIIPAPKNCDLDMYLINKLSGLDVNDLYPDSRFDYDLLMLLTPEDTGNLIHRWYPPSWVA